MAAFTFLVSIFIVAWLLCSAMIPVAHTTGLVDRPCSRKQHLGEIPLIGGLATAISVFVLWALYFQFNIAFAALLVSSALMVSTGVLDDRFDLSVRVRLLMQTVSASILVLFAGIEITTLGNLFGFLPGNGEILLGEFSGVFTVLAIMAAMNAYNMIDGIDGLLGSLSLITFSGIALLSWHSGQLIPLLFSVIFLVALLPFLFRNLQSQGGRVKKIFMGDAGSMFIGLIAVWLFALLTNPSLSGFYQLRDPFFFDVAIGERSSVRPIAVLWLITIPLMDMIGIMARRLIKRENPFKPDRNHLHHIFMRAGFTPREALLVISLSALWWMLVGITLEIFKVPEWVVLAVFLFVFVVYLLSLKYCWRLLVFVRKLRGID